MVVLKVRKAGNSLDVVLPGEVINRLHAQDGQTLFLVEAPDGGHRLTRSRLRAENGAGRSD